MDRLTTVLCLPCDRVSFLIVLIFPHIPGGFFFTFPFSGVIIHWEARFEDTPLGGLMKYGVLFILFFGLVYLDISTRR